MDDILVLTNGYNKQNYIKKNSLQLTPRKVMTFSEFKEKLTFSYDERALYEVMKETGVSYGVARLYLMNLTDQKIDTPKIRLLNQIYHHLQEKKLLIQNPLFKDFVKSKKILVYGNTSLNKEEKKLLSGYSYTISKVENYPNRKYPLYSLATLEEEVYFLASKISKLLKEGILPHQIKILNLDDEYRMMIEKIFAWYHIPTSIGVNRSIIGTKMVKDFLENSSLQGGLEKLQGEIHTPLGEKIYDQLRTIVMRYSDFPEDDITRTMIEEDIKNAHMVVNVKEESVEEGNLDTLYDEDFHIFIVGCNEGIIPRTYKDEDYLSDDEKTKLERMTSIEKNQEEKKKLFDFLNHTQNIILSYKEKTYTDTYYPASFLEEIETSKETFTMDYQDSHFINRFYLGKMLDSYYKYNLKLEDLEYLYQHYRTIPYHIYQNQYTGVSKKQLEEVFEHKLLLSYSSLDTYYRCSFRYYVEKVLKLSTFESTFLQNVGNLFHYVLSKAFLEDFDFEKEWNDSIQKNGMGITKKEQFFLKKLKIELQFIIEEIKRQYHFTTLKDAFYEEKIYTHPTGEENITFMGIIDKLLYNSKTNIVSVIDYKTGNPNLSLENIPYGIEMQLPIYLYLVKHFSKIDNPRIAGFYLQKILHNEIMKSDKKTYEQLKRENLLLQGYSTDNREVLEAFDNTCADSEMIKSMKITNKGFYAYSKVLSEREMDTMIQLVEEKIEGALKDILEGKFTINPKQIGMDNVGCAFCPYHDICYHTENDMVTLKQNRDLKFLRGDENA